MTVGWGWLYPEELIVILVPSTAVLGVQARIIAGIVSKVADGRRRSADVYLIQLQLLARKCLTWRWKKFTGYTMYSVAWEIPQHWCTKRSNGAATHPPAPILFAAPESAVRPSKALCPK